MIDSILRTADIDAVYMLIAFIIAFIIMIVMLRKALTLNDSDEIIIHA